MVNFLEETRKALGVVMCDSVMFIGSRDGEYECTWDEFEVLADFEYDNSFGTAEIPQDLVIVLHNGTRYRRGEYDGSEWWVCVESIPKVDNPKRILNLSPTNPSIGRFTSNSVKDTNVVLSDEEARDKKDYIEDWY